MRKEMMYQVEIVFLTFVSICYAEDFYLKKDHSLVKPYQGILECFLQYIMLFSNSTFNVKKNI